MERLDAGCMSSRSDVNRADGRGYEFNMLTLARTQCDFAVAQAGDGGLQLTALHHNHDHS